MNVDSAENRGANSSFQTPKVITNSYSFNNIKKSGSGILDPNSSTTSDAPNILTQTMHPGGAADAFRTKVVVGGGGGKRNSTNLSTIDQPSTTTASASTNQAEDSSSTLARRGGPPKTHYHKLPSAFAFSSIPQPKKLKPGFLAMGIQPPSKIPEEENIVSKIDNMVDVSEYKQIQNLLSPLKIREGKVMHSKQKKLFSFHEQSASSQQAGVGSSVLTTIPNSNNNNSSNHEKLGSTLLNPISNNDGMILNPKNGIFSAASAANHPITSNQIARGIGAGIAKDRIAPSNNYPNSSSSIAVSHNPLREYMETMQKFKDQFKDSPDLLLDKINSLIMKNDRQFAPPAQLQEQSQIKQAINSSNNLPFVPDMILRKAMTLKQPKEEPLLLPSSLSSNPPPQLGLKSHSSLSGGNANSISGNNTNSNNNNNNNSISNFKVKLEEMITLNFLTTNKNSGAMKKMLHAPTLAIFAVKEQPIGSKEVRKILRDWLQFWPSLNSNEQFCRVYGTCWNVPEGCVSIIMEHVNGGSLQNLLENVGNLSERALQELSIQVLSALFTLHTEHGITHGNLSPSQILFNKSGFLKLSLGVTSRTQASANNHNNANSNNNHNIFHTISNSRSDKKTLFDHSSLANVWSKNMLERQEEVSQLQESIDRAEEVFKFGLLLLVSAIGSLDLIDDSFVAFFEQVQKQIEAANKLSHPQETLPPSDAPCSSCFIHDEANLIQMLRQQESQSTATSSKKSTNATSESTTTTTSNNPPSITIQKLLGNFSASFKDLLCKCLQYNQKKRATIDDLLLHSFIKGKTIYSSQPSLCELIGVSNKISMQTVALPDRYQAASERQLDRVCEGIQMILPNCHSWFKVPHYAEFVQHLPLLEHNNPFILALANDLGIQSVKVHAKIIAAYESVQLFKDFKHKFIFKPA